MFKDFDEKGKIFTNVVSKVPIEVIIQTVSARIHGEIHVKPDERLKDELNQSEQFLAVTNAKILDQEGNPPYESQFLTINKNQIIWIIPEGDLENSKKE